MKTVFKKIIMVFLKNKNQQLSDFDINLFLGTNGYQKIKSNTHPTPKST
jgi:hypothetical protein